MEELLEYNLDPRILKRIQKDLAIFELLQDL